MNSSIFKLGDLSVSDIEWLKATATSKTIAKGELLICQAQSSKELSILIEGELAIFVSASGREERKDEREISTLQSGAIIGVISFIDRLPSWSNVKAIEESTLWILSDEKLTAKLKQDEGFAARFYQTIAAQISSKLRRISSLLVQKQTLNEPPLRKVLFVFGILNDSDIDWMTDNGKRVNSPPNTTLIKQGETVEYLYILLDGTLAVSITVSEGDATISKEVTKLASGEMVGEMSFVETGKASANVKSFEESLLLAIPQQQLAAKLKEDMQFASRFYQAIAVVLVDRLRDGLARRGYGYISNLSQLDEDIEYEGELDLNILNQTALAGTRFQWMLRRVISSY
ncbi:MAG TPA: cyclic nucleotide-binding domain-containing protein [Leptolyngbyaceae cyanobacterium]